MPAQTAAAASSKPLELLTDAEDAFLANLKKGQDAVVEAVRTLTEALKPVIDALPAAPAFLDKLPTPEDLINNGADFAEKIVAARREYAEQLLAALQGK